MTSQLLHADGFEHYGTLAEITNIYAMGGFGPGLINNAALARTGHYYVSFNNYGDSMFWTYPVFNTSTVLSMGVRWNGDGDSNIDTPMQVKFQDGTIIAASCSSFQEFKIYIAPQGSNAVIVARSNPKAYVGGTWNWIELLIDTVAQKVEVRVNNAVVITYTGAAVPANGLIAQWHATCNQDQLFDIDDLVILSGTDYPGDRRCFTMFPASDTASADWAITGSTDGGFDALNNVPPDPTQYVSATAAGQSSTFNLTPLPSGAASVLGVCMYTKSEKTDAGNCNVQTAFHVNGSDGLGANRPQNAYLTWNEDVVALNPLTNAPYTVNEVNSAQVKLTRTL